MNYSRHFLIEGKFLGTAQITGEWKTEHFISPRGYSFFCPHCGRLWAECPVEGEPAMVWSMTCAQHRTGERTGRQMQVDRLGCMIVAPFEVPGSIQLPWEPAFADRFPAAVWEHELRVHLSWAASAFREPIASNCQSMLSYLSANIKRRPPCLIQSPIQ